MSRARGFCAFGLGLFLLTSACRAPTEIRLEIRTNVPCTSKAKGWRGVAVYAGSSGAEERGDAPVLVTHDCDADGRIGSLVLVPSGDKDEAVRIRVVAGVSDDPRLSPEDCAARDYAGCIVARRAVKYVAHESLELDIDLTNDCFNLGCDPEHTCSVGGCVGVDEAASAVPDASAHTVHCGDNNAVCSTSGAVCCLSVDTENQTTHGACMQPKDCPPANVVLNCDDDGDCDELDSELGPGMCILSFTTLPDDYYKPQTISSSQCLAAGHQFERTNVGLALCQSRQPCNNGKARCIESGGSPVNQLPGYFWCEVSNNQ
ncbi:MAG TPA: hypothetical protein VHB79_01865 [Polyangiaceae bacterium]|nr:hypothetical protein [Polyangiaceae bacterium]